MGRGLVQGHPGIGDRGRTGTLPAVFSLGSQCALSSHTRPYAEQPCCLGLGSREGGCPAELGDMLAGVSGKKNRLDCAFQGRGLWVFPRPDHQGMALSCSQKGLPPAPEEGRNGEPGALELGDWGRRGKDLRTARPGGQLHLGAEPCQGWDHFVPGAG